MNFFMRLLFGLVLIVAALVGISFLLPSEWKVERSITINASPEKVYSLVANFNTGWPQWSAFDAAYSDSVYSSSGPESGVGATRAWTSATMGDGSQTIVKADPKEGIEFDLTMHKYDATLRGQILFTPVEGGTLVRWIDVGQTGNNPISRWMGLFMDRMMGGMFEQSLQNLKNLAESA
jgi:uncharacterized protein YndB with AHSA1/START domain